MRVSIVGAGSWGTAVYRHLLLNGHDVSIWARREETAREIRSGQNRTYLPGVDLPEGYVSTDLNEIVERGDVVVFAVPAQHMRDVLKKIHVPVRKAINLAKGIEISSGRRMEEIFSEEISPEMYATLSGPSHAEEVARDIPTAVVVASRDVEFSVGVQTMFSGRNFRVYTSDDVVGVEIAGSLKNVIAVAAGVIDGLGGWDNSKAALMTRGIAEMARFGLRFGARLETFMGLAGIGDLIVTCTSKYSRNRRVGEMIGKGMDISSVLKNMKMVAEGVYTVRAVHEISLKNKIYMPITEHVYRVIYEGMDPRGAVESLMKRPMKPEWSW